jgi:hypothetical protein
MVAHPGSQNARGPQTTLCGLVPFQGQTNSICKQKGKYQTSRKSDEHTAALAGSQEDNLLSPLSNAWIPFKLCHQLSVLLVEAAWESANNALMTLLGCASVYSRLHRRCCVSDWLLSFRLCQTTAAHTTGDTLLRKLSFFELLSRPEVLTLPHIDFVQQQKAGF